MKKKVGVFVLLLVGAVVHGQTLATWIAGYANPVMQLQWFQNAENTAQMVVSMADQLKSLIQVAEDTDSMFQAQINAIQDLGEGGWSGFVKAFNDEAVVTDDLSAALQQGATTWKLYGGTVSQDYADTVTQSQNLATMTNAQATVINNVDTLQANARTRTTQAQNLLNSAKSSNSSPTTQLVVGNQLMAMTQQTLTDTQNVAYAQMSLDRQQAQIMAIDLQTYMTQQNKVMAPAATYSEGETTATAQQYNDIALTVQ